jgi:hypothetical protein
MDERKVAALCAALAVGLAVVSCERSVSEPRGPVLSGSETGTAPARPQGGPIPVLRPPPARLIEVAARNAPCSGHVLGPFARACPMARQTCQPGA